MKKVSLLLLCMLASIVGVKAQIGYQISLLNTATGEPRANETVTVSVSLSNNANEVFYSETKSATTNDFGVLSLSIGNADTFKNVDLSKMPFFIEVTANGVMIGKSQMLSVPVAEVAKQLAPIDKSEIVGAWNGVVNGAGLYNVTYFFNENGTGNKITYYNGKILEGRYYSYNFEYFIIGNQVFTTYIINHDSGAKLVEVTSNIYYYNGSLIIGDSFFQKQ